LQNLGEISLHVNCEIHLSLLKFLPIFLFR